MTTPSTTRKLSAEMRALVLMCWLCAAGCSRDIAAAAPAPLQVVPTEPEPAACITKAGCPPAPALLACPAGLITQTLAEVTGHGARSLGKQIAVRGPLHHTQTMCTETKCAPGSCCNRCTAHLVLATRDDVRPFDGARDAILLYSVGGSDRFRCVGDDSAVCCTTAVDGADVVAQGTLARAGVAEDSRTWELTEPTLCHAVTRP